MSDALVIGAGPNGLAAAIRLAEAGRDVTLLEARDQPGGAVRTEELTLPGFLHDTFSAVHPAGAASPVFRRMPLSQHGLDWVHPHACSAHVLPEGRAAVLYRDVASTVRNLDALHAGDGQRWAAFAEPFVESFDAVRATMLAGFPPVGGPVKLLLGAGPLRLLDFTRLLPGSAVGFSHRLFEGDGARAWLFSAAMHGDAPPNKPGSAIAAFYLNLLGHGVGWPSPRGGAGRLTDALVSYFESLGGTVRTGARVERITSAGGRVTGVGIAGGEHLQARLVIADVMPHALVEMAGEGLASWYRRALRRYVYGAGTLKLDWALDGSIPWINEETRRAGTVHVGGGGEEFLQSIRQGASGFPDRPFMLAGQQSIADPSRAPEGKHTAWAYTHAPPDADWARQQERHAERMEEHIERYAPGFRDRILARHLMGPAELEARNENLIRGDVGGGSYKLSQVVFRPIPSLSPYRTTLDGLYLGSAAAFPGGAVHGVPGDAAARAALRGKH